MDRFRELEVFVAVAEHGAFNAAARSLSTSPPAVTRLVGALEERLGVRLLTRTTRRVALTGAGERLLSDAKRILAELAGAEASAAGEHDAPRGMLRLTAPVLFGQSYVAPVLRAFLDDHPSVTATAAFLDRNVDLIDEGYDVAVRIGDLPDSELVAIRVGTVRRIVVASPGYLAGRGVPASPGGLSEHRIIQSMSAWATTAWDFAGHGGRKAVRIEPALTVNTMAAAIDAAEAGWGITRVLSYQVADAVADGRLVEILGDHEDRLLPIHLVHSEGTRPSAKIRTFVDYAADRLRAAVGSLTARP